MEQNTADAAKKRRLTHAGTVVIAKTPSPRRPRQRRRLASIPNESAKATTPSNDAESTHENDTKDAEKDGLDEVLQDRVEHVDEEDALSILPCDISPSGNLYDFLTINTTDVASFSLFTPSPAMRTTHKATTNSGSTFSSLSPSATGCRTADSLTSPSHFFRSPFNDHHRTTSHKSTTSATTKTQVSPKLSITIKPEPDAESAIPSTASSTAVIRSPDASLSWPRNNLSMRTPSPPTTHRVKRTPSNARKPTTDTAAAPQSHEVDVDEDDLLCVPSALSDQESFYSFTHSWSPLVPAEELEATTNFLSLRLSPLITLPNHCELPRLIPPFPMPKLDEEDEESSTDSQPETPVAIKHEVPTPEHLRTRTPRTPASHSGSSSTSSSASTCSPAFGSDFPNIQASTSATPGQEERLKVSPHSVIKVQLHVPFESLSSSHTKREMQAINDSLKRKSRHRRRKLDEKVPSTVETTSKPLNVQRKLLQTPVKTATVPTASPPRLPLHPPPSQEEGPTSTTGVARRLASTPTAKASMLQEPKATTTPSLRMTASSVFNAPSTAVKAPTSTTPLQALRLRKTSPDVNTKTPATTAPATPVTLKTSPPPVTPVTTSHHAFRTTSLGFAPLKTKMSPVPEIAADAPAAPSSIAKKAPCNCKKSKCLKLYCECFASGGYCGPHCNCLDCANTPATEAIRQQAMALRLEKNPNAFKPKIASTITPVKTTTSKRTPMIPQAAQAPVTPLHQTVGLGLKKMHKHGCHCKKSACRKKYCECFQAGVPCGDNCRCIDCKNQPSVVETPTTTAAVASASAIMMTNAPLESSRELEETFVSPMLIGVRQRPRVMIDRETWTKNFSSPFEGSPERERARTQRVRAAQMRSITPSSYANRMQMMQTPAKKTIASVPRIEPLPETAPAPPPPAELKEKQPAKKAIKNVMVLPLFGETQPPVQEPVAAKIFQYLDNADLYNASLVSQLWNAVAMGESVWDHANYIRLHLTVTSSSIP